jgi:hypothetical protein
LLWSNSNYAKRSLLQKGVQKIFRVSALWSYHSSKNEFSKIFKKWLFFSEMWNPFGGITLNNFSQTQFQMLKVAHVFGDDSRSIHFLNFYPTVCVGCRDKRNLSNSLLYIRLQKPIVRKVKWSEILLLFTKKNYFLLKIWIFYN